jgi:hypothetical protein
MAKAKGGGKLHPLPFTTFGKILALGLKAMVFCPSCYEHRPIDPMAEHLRGRCFATTRFRCTNIRYTGDVCGCTGSVEIEPTVLLPVGGKNYLAFLCGSCQPSWEINHVLIDQPPWSVVKRVLGGLHDVDYRTKTFSCSTADQKRHDRLSARRSRETGAPSGRRQAPHRTTAAPDIEPWR